MITKFILVCLEVSRPSLSISGDLVRVLAKCLSVKEIEWVQVGTQEGTDRTGHFAGKRPTLPSSTALRASVLRQCVTVFSATLLNCVTLKQKTNLQRFPHLIHTYHGSCLLPGETLLC